MNRDTVDFNLERFLKQQTFDYATALREIKNGKKRSHWIWYIFPQLKGLGRSYNSKYYGISSIEEAKAYLEHPVLGTRLREITQALLDCDNKSAKDILGVPDNRKVKSSMTLFDLVSPNDIFNDVLNKYYEGRRCKRTIKWQGPQENK